MTEFQDTDSHFKRGVEIGLTWWFFSAIDKKLSRRFPRTMLVSHLLCWAIVLTLVIWVAVLMITAP